MIGHQLAVRDDFRLVIIRPVVEAGSKPGAAWLAASHHGVVVQSGRPQVGVVQVVRRPVEKILALHPRCPGRWSKEGALSRQTDWSELAKRNLVTKVKKRRKGKLTIGGGWAREYGSLPNCHSS